MKQQNFHVFLLSLLFLHLLILSPFLASKFPFLLPVQAEKKVITADGIAQVRFPKELKDYMELQPMGLELEHCFVEDEECYRRRMISEAHLDYLYI